MTPEQPERLLIAADHAGYALKEYLKEKLTVLNYSVEDFGAFSEESLDYPDVVHPLARALEEVAPLPLKGILVCGSGSGVCITANKYAHIRAAVAWEPEIARLLREHNDGNVLCLPARFIDRNVALECVFTFLETDFEGGRHERRVRKIDPKSFLEAEEAYF